MKMKSEICNSFNAHAAEYEQAAKIQYEIGKRLSERLSYLKISPRFILDLGCGTGFFSLQLKSLYPKAQVIGLDFAFLMLRQAKKKQGFRKKWPLVNADMQQLPFVDGLFDLIFANQAIHWAKSMPSLFNELNRVMNTHGCLMFSTLGPDTFKELKMSWSHDPHAHSNDFPDMHDLGDELLQSHFLDPVVDMEMLTVHYQSPSHLVRSLKAQGVRNINPARNKGLTGKESFKKFTYAMEEMKTETNHYPLSYEVVYGHAWKGSRRVGAKGTETLIPVTSLRRR